MWLAAFAGLLIGSTINWAADVLPRFAGRPDHPLPRFRVSVAAVECVTALAFAIIWAQTPAPLAAAAISTAFALLLLIAVTDIRHRLIPNIVVYPLLLLVFAASVGTNADLRPLIMGGALAFGIFALTGWLKPGSLGGGDVKLAALIGFTFGFPQVLWALIVGVGSGGLIAGWLLLSQRGKRGTRIPYAPFLCFGAMIALLYNPVTWSFR